MKKTNDHVCESEINISGARAATLVEVELVVEWRILAL